MLVVAPHPTLSFHARMGRPAMYYIEPHDIGTGTSQGTRSDLHSAKQTVPVFFRIDLEAKVWGHAQPNETYASICCNNW